MAGLITVGMGGQKRALDDMLMAILNVNVSVDAVGSK